MALMLSKTYAAFKAAGVDEDQAQAAAEELAAFETHFGSMETNVLHIDGKITAIEGKVGAIDTKIGTLEGRVSAIEGKIGGIDGKIAILMWALGINAAATIAILGVLLRHG
jgi:hypothetical protein